MTFYYFAQVVLYPLFHIENLCRAFRIEGRNQKSSDLHVDMVGSVTELDLFSMMPGGQ